MKFIVQVLKGKRQRNTVFLPTALRCAPAARVMREPLGGHVSVQQVG